MNYVNGFLFRYEGRQVALIEKQKPEWQKGRLNGIGGKIEDGETPIEAMQREFKEETGSDVNTWEQFAVLNHSGHVIYFFVGYGDKNLSSPTEEKVGWYECGSLHELPVIENLKWLIPLGLDPDRLTAVINDESTPWESKCLQGTNG